MWDASEGGDEKVSEGGDALKTYKQASLTPLSFFNSTWRGCRRRERVLFAVRKNFDLRAIVEIFIRPSP